MVYVHMVHVIVNLVTVVLIVKTKMVVKLIVMVMAYVTIKNVSVTLVSLVPIVMYSLKISHVSITVLATVFVVMVYASVLMTWYSIHFSRSWCTLIVHLVTYVLYRLETIAQLQVSVPSKTVQVMVSVDTANVGVNLDTMVLIVTLVVVMVVALNMAHVYWEYVNVYLVIQVLIVPIC
jgi:hypothetical protein